MTPLAPARLHRRAARCLPKGHRHTAHGTLAYEPCLGIFASATAVTQHFIPRASSLPRSSVVGHFRLGRPFLARVLQCEHESASPATITVHASNDSIGDDCDQHSIRCRVACALEALAGVLIILAGAFAGAAIAALPKVGRTVGATFNPQAVLRSWCRLGLRHCRICTRNAVQRPKIASTLPGR